MLRCWGVCMRGVGYRGAWEVDGEGAVLVGTQLHLDARPTTTHRRPCTRPAALCTNDTPSNPSSVQVKQGTPTGPPTDPAKKEWDRGKR